MCPYPPFPHQPAVVLYPATTASSSSSSLSRGTAPVENVWPLFFKFGQAPLAARSVHPPTGRTALNARVRHQFINTFMILLLLSIFLYATLVTSIPRYCNAPTLLCLPLLQCRDGGGAGDFQLYTSLFVQASSRTVWLTVFQRLYSVSVTLRTYRESFLQYLATVHVLVQPYLGPANIPSTCIYLSTAYRIASPLYKYTSHHWNICTMMM